MRPACPIPVVALGPSPRLGWSEHLRPGHGAEASRSRPGPSPSDHPPGSPPAVHRRRCRSRSPWPPRRRRRAQGVRVPEVEAAMPGGCAWEPVWVPRRRRRAGCARVRRRGRSATGPAPKGPRTTRGSARGAAHRPRRAGRDPAAHPRTRIYAHPGTLPLAGSRYIMWAGTISALARRRYTRPPRPVKGSRLERGEHCRQSVGKSSEAHWSGLRQRRS